MSINNDGRSSIMAVSRTSYLNSGTVYKRSVSGVEEKQHAERNVKSGIGELSSDRRKSTGNFFINNSAQEIHQTISDGFQELSFLSQKRAHPFAYVNSSSDAQSDYNQRDLKRHQNYFNQIMNYENPAGSWVDVQA
ncbi:MAG: hypothetical protein NXI08_12915 [bacterium]|nr:hypothetical protein [bacterium]